MTNISKRMHIVLLSSNLHQQHAHKNVVVLGIRILE